ncbi:ABC transporter ATP-binding protein [Glaciihabitans sp. dw_435]|uniref:ABC transporter ATP-binding protein n=1 Tax=Glaciihabitans sp. dw_435 TaxID=2720081 RepID=UPI0027DC6136|nr:ABC transporter ATP-binding protein [Glaciihabitans sp. dw_435]
MNSLTIENLTISVATSSGQREIVSGIDITLERGRIHGLAGESGSGKTMTALAVLNLLPERAQLTGSIRLAPRDTTLGDPTEIVGASKRVMGAIRGRRIAMVFQDPSTSLHPQLSIGQQLTDHVRHHLGLNKRDATARAVELLTRVRVPNPEGALKRYPHQFSGGQRQRIAIAVALACDPEVLLADEPTTALDVTVQAGVLQLLRELVDETNLTVLLVTHDLGVMSAVADEVTIMKAGRIVESGPRQRIFTAPEHEYTRALLAALPGSTVEEDADTLAQQLAAAAELPDDAERLDDTDFPDRSELPDAPGDGTPPSLSDADLPIGSSVLPGQADLPDVAGFPSRPGSHRAESSATLDISDGPDEERTHV